MRRKIIFNWIFYISIIISGLILIFMIITYKNNLKDNNMSKNNNKQVYYKNINITEIFNISPPLEKISDEQKLKILESLNIFWSVNKYQSNSAKNAKYKNFDLGEIQNLEELSLEELKQIVDFQESKLKIKGKEEGRQESRQSIYQLCVKTFKYYECYLDPRIILNFEGFNEYKEGSEPNINLNNEEVVQTLINLYPTVKNKLSNGELIKIGTIGLIGKPKIFGSLFYEERKILDFSKEISSFMQFNSENFLTYFSFLFDEKLFSPFIEDGIPMYDQNPLNFLPLGFKIEQITNKEKLQILGWDDKFLKII